MSQEESRKRKSEVFKENDSEESSSEPQTKSFRLSEPLEVPEAKNPNLEEEENINGKNLSSSPPRASLIVSDDDVELIDATDAKNENEYVVHSSNSEEEPSSTENAQVEAPRNAENAHSPETTNEAIVVHSSSDSEEVVVDGDTPEKKFNNPFESAESSQESLEISVGQPSPQKNFEDIDEAAENSPEDMNLVVDIDSPEKRLVVGEKTQQVIEQTGESSEANDAIILQSSPESEIIVVDEDKLDQNDCEAEQVAEIAGVIEIQTSEETPVSGDNAAVEEKSGDCPTTDIDISSGIVPESTNNSQEFRSESSCSISIRFQDESIADMYRLKFLDFISTIKGLQIKSCDKLTIDVCHDNSCQNFVVEEEEVVSQSIAHAEVISKHSPKKHKKKNKTKRELFMVDATPSPQTSKTQEPQYITKFTLNLDADGSTETKESISNKQACFNCGGKHSVRECPVPKDYGKINAARQRFGRQQAKSSRYHLEEDQKYSHLAPGKLSSELRKALGLRRNEMPDYIYKMRRLGYPPGWLEEAKHVSSNLGMFGIDGKHVKEDPKQKKRGLDAGKIVDYPGFNVPPEQGMRDDFRAFGVPPYSDEFSKEAMINYFNNLQEQEEPQTTPPPTDRNRRRKENSRSNDAKEEGKEETEEAHDDDDDDGFVVVDMEVSADAEAHENPDEDDSNIEDSFQLPAPPGTEERKAAAADATEVTAATVAELEEKKQELLKKLEDVEKPGNDYLAVKTTHFGTPILKSSSPYMRLPHADNFSKDVSPVINFENLPNSTGKYEQMTDVLQKVRTTLKKLQDCNL